MNFVVNLLFYGMIVSQAMSYYFYNAKTKQVLSTNTLNVPEGFRIMQPPKTVKFNKETFTRGLYCQDIGFSCTQQFNYSSTYQFECETDSNCPKSFICCPQKCFQHKVCIKAATKLISRNSNINISAKPENRNTFKNDNGRCEKWPYNCYQPYPAYLTYKFKCDYDEQCPNGFKCCQQDCYTHKICSKSYKNVEELTRDNNEPTKLNGKKYENAETTQTVYRLGINENTENDKYWQTNLVENTTDLVRTTRDVSHQNKSDTEEEKNSTEEEEEENSTGEDCATEEDCPTKPKNVTEHVNYSQTPDPNYIDPDYHEYYEDENEDEDVEEEYAGLP